MGVLVNPNMTEYRRSLLFTVAAMLA